MMPAEVKKKPEFPGIGTSGFMFFQRWKKG
jgi:hypothetical protein